MATIFDLPPSCPDALPVPRAAVVCMSAPPVVELAAVPPARPGHVAEREELDVALKSGTREALDLFIARHPNSRYRAEAEEARERLRQPNRP